jgi:hypothetical protein
MTVPPFGSRRFPNLFACTPQSTYCWFSIFSQADFRPWVSGRVDNAQKGLYNGSSGKELQPDLRSTV